MTAQSLVVLVFILERKRGSCLQSQSSENLSQVAGRKKKRKNKCEHTATNFSRIDFQEMHQCAGVKLFGGVASIIAVPMGLGIRTSDQPFIRDGNVCKGTEISYFIVL